MRYYIDQDLSPKIAEILKKNKVDALSAYHVGMLHVSDEKQLEYASEHRRCLVTRNRNDFIALTIQFFNENRKHYGVLIIPYTLDEKKFSLIAKAIAKHTSNYPKGVSSYSIDYLKG